MKSPFRTINIYLLGGAVLVVALAGCQAKKDEDLKKQAVVRLHLEVKKEVVRRSTEVDIIRSHPIRLNMSDDFVLHEGYLEAATMVDTPEGGYAIKLEYNQQGAWTLRNVTSVNTGKHIGVSAQFYPETRWLAAPIIEHPITNGVFSFTPDASREETRKIVDGLNYTVEKRKKESFFND
jgi:hypothetical protein